MLSFRWLGSKWWVVAMIGRLQLVNDSSNVIAGCSYQQALFSRSSQIARVKLSAAFCFYRLPYVWRICFVLALFLFLDRDRDEDGEGEWREGELFFVEVSVEGVSSKNPNLIYPAPAPRAIPTLSKRTS